MKEKIFLFVVLVLTFILFIGPVRYFLSSGVNFDLAKMKIYPLYIKGVYLTSWTASDSKRVNYFLNLVKQTELNAVVIDIKEVDGRIVFNTESSLINELGTENVLISNLKEVIEKFHKENIYVIARIVVFKDKSLPFIKPELALKSKLGGFWKDWRGKTWLDPASHEVWEYHVEIAKQAVKIGFDEINFDYIRFPSDGNISEIVYPIWDGKTPKPEIMRQFFEYISEQLKPTGVFLSVDLFGLTMVREDDMNIGQVLEGAIPYFDFICPMVYPSHYPKGYEGFDNPAAYPYEVIKMNLKRGQERIASVSAEARLRPWLQDFDMGAIYNKRMIELQKQAVYDTDSYGWLLWNPANIYTEDALERR